MRKGYYFITYYGEREREKENNSMGSFSYTNMTKITLSLSVDLVDDDNILNVYRQNIVFFKEIKS